MKKLYVLLVLFAFNLVALAQHQNDDSHQLPSDKPTTNGSYCCSKNFKNLIVNGNFEYGNTGFLSAYTTSSNPYPGEYEVTTSAVDFDAKIKDHSYCDSPNQYPTNNLFMTVNGKTQQAGENTVWAQKISGLKKGERYKFCANFKDMEQCTFNIFPKVTMKVGASSTTFTVNTDDNDPCDWLGKELTFIATGPTMGVQIILDEKGNGDGNDLAIDDIAVFTINNDVIPITVQHEGSTGKITASVGSISSSDDGYYAQLKECGYRWYVIEVTKFSPLTLDFSTLAWGDASGSDLPPYPGYHAGPAWNTTTTFPGYPFQQNKLYLVGLYVPRCGCYGRSQFTYQLTFNNKNSGEKPQMEKEDQDKIIKIITSKQKVVSSDGQKDKYRVSNKTGEIILYPNPSNTKVSIKTLNAPVQSVRVVNMNGQVVFKEVYKSSKKTQELNISTLVPGMYFVKAIDSNKKEYNLKLMKE